ncbi:MAG: hypothetical protein PHD03_02660 [Bacilli bacterium]|nr:hypothetical protein [Bacilli bacterium]MDD4407097.1 hypothetical protein [Bacilli bacterium]
MIIKKDNKFLLLGIVAIILGIILFQMEYKIFTSFIFLWNLLINNFVDTLACFLVILGIIFFYKSLKYKKTNLINDISDINNSHQLLKFRDKKEKMILENIFKK